jgi:hypothetical protein
MTCTRRARRVWTSGRTVLFLVAGLVRCGGREEPAAALHGSVTGILNPQDVMMAETVFSWPGEGLHQAVALAAILSDKPGLCGTPTPLGRERYWTSYEKTLRVALVIRDSKWTTPQDARDALDYLALPVTVPLVDSSTLGPAWNGMIGSVTALAGAERCHDFYRNQRAIAGTLTVKTRTTDAFTGDFEAEFDDGHVGGTFVARTCDAQAAEPGMLCPGEGNIAGAPEPH